jgi:hypothetical protein
MEQTATVGTDLQCVGRFVVRVSRVSCTQAAYYELHNARCILYVAHCILYVAHCITLHDDT